MKLLLDTHVFYWLLRSPDRVRASTASTLADPRHVLFVSAASVYEITLKRALGKLSWPGGVAERIVSYGFTPLPISPAHADAAGLLPLHHRDPFDRLLIAQASIEAMTLVSADRQLMDYDVDLLRA